MGRCFLRIISLYMHWLSRSMGRHNRRYSTTATLNPNPYWWIITHNEWFMSGICITHISSYTGLENTLRRLSSMNATFLHKCTILYVGMSQSTLLSQSLPSCAYACEYTNTHMHTCTRTNTQTDRRGPPTHAEWRGSLYCVSVLFQSYLIPIVFVWLWITSLVSCMVTSCEEDAILICSHSFLMPSGGAQHQMYIWIDFVTYCHKSLLVVGFRPQYRLLFDLYLQPWTELYFSCSRDYW